jgi:putative transposase
MLRSYTRAINLQEKRSGSLFRKETKAVCITKSDGITESWYTTMGITIINTAIAEKQYPNICFNYIHMNPVRDGLASGSEEWQYSSSREYVEKPVDALSNNEAAKKLGIIV